MKGLKEFIPLLKLIGKDKYKLIFASILIFICGIAEIFTGYLNGKAVTCITNLELKMSLMYLGIYFILGITLDGFVVFYARSILYKLESLKVLIIVLTKW